MFDYVNTYLRDLANRALNDRHKRGESRPDVDTLSQALSRYVRAELAHLVYDQDYGEQRASGRHRARYLDGDRAVDAVALSAARYVLNKWSPSYIVECRISGYLGGKKSKRPSEWTTDEMLDELKRIGGTKNSQATYFGVSISTIDKMRRALRDRELQSE